MIEHIGGNPAANQVPLGHFLKTISILRIGAGLLLLTQHGWVAARGAYEFLWEEKGWDWVKAFSDVGLPYPTLLAPTLALLVAAVAVSWCVGFLTRLFSVIFMPVALGVIALAGPSYMEVGWLYLLISITLLLYGSGAVSIDRLFSLGQSWGQPKKSKW
jgi:uncharacterized membrane protein YphA (DoxX/SURF4 family)